jgi:hypothetical protein
VSSIQSYAVTRNGTVSISAFPRFDITALVLADDGSTIADFTGANSLQFPAIVKTTLAAHPELVPVFIDLVASWLVRANAGTLDPLTGR